MLFIQDASSYESFYPEAESVFRVTTRFVDTREDRMTSVPSRATYVSRERIPEVEQMTFMLDWSVGREPLVEVGDRKFIEPEMYYADSAYFKVFQHELIQGDRDELLTEPTDIVLTESMAMKLFDRKEVLGETVKINGSDYKVDAVVKDFPGKTSLAFSILLSTERLNYMNLEGWFPMNYFTYVKVANEEAANSFLTKLNGIIKDELGEDMASEGYEMSFEIQPLLDMHFETGISGDYPEKLSKNLMYSLIAISAFILFIACINYINLSTAKSEKRAKEVGIRKVLGARKPQLIWQFYGETFMITFLSVIIGVVLTEVVLPTFNNVSGTDLELNIFNNLDMLGALLGLTIFVSLLSGSYPANFLSSFSPVKVLKGTFSVKGGNIFRRVLVTLQFVVSVFLIIGTITIYYQLDFIQSKDIGYERDQVVFMRMGDRNVRGAYEQMKERFRLITGVEAVTGSNNMISNIVSGWGSEMEGLPEGVNISFRGQNGDEEFLETFGFDLVAGKSFANISDIDSTMYYLMNETGIRELGLTPEEAIGKRFGLADDRMGTIVGIVEDFHLTSLHSEIEPWAVYTGPDKYMGVMYARVNMDRIAEIKEEMAAVWEEYVPTRPFDMQFVDDAVGKAYEKDQQLGQIIITFTLLAILIGCLGLFGLASYLAEKRTKEIGIRKVLGADVTRIVYLLSQEYFKIILISNLIAWPLAYFFMDNWLSTFAYRIQLSWFVFLGAALATVFVAAITVSYQSIKAAFSNPINALRNE